MPKKYEDVAHDLLQKLREGKEPVSLEELGGRFREAMSPNAGVYEKLTDQQLGQGLVKEFHELGEHVAWRGLEYGEEINKK